MALADAMVQAGHFTTNEWASALGEALELAEANRDPDTLDTYYTAVILALEHLSEHRMSISAKERAQRRADWEAAYERTPHGMPVKL